MPARAPFECLAPRDYSSREKEEEKMKTNWATRGVLFYMRDMMCLAVQAKELGGWVAPAFHITISKVCLSQFQRWRGAIYALVVLTTRVTSSKVGRTRRHLRIDRLNHDE